MRSKNKFPSSGMKYHRRHMHRRHRYCLKRRQIKSSWSVPNTINLIHMHPLILNDKSMTLFQVLWKCRTLARLYFNGDVTLKTFKKMWDINKGNVFHTLCHMERRVDQVMHRCVGSFVGKNRLIMPHCTKWN